MVIFLGGNTLTSFLYENKQRNWYYCHTPTLNALLYTFKHLPFVDRTLYFLHPCCLDSVPKYSFGQNCH